jgi:hypothetical protein
LKRKIKSSLSHVDEPGIAFDYQGEVTAQDAEEILQKMKHLHARRRYTFSQPTFTRRSTSSIRAGAAGFLYLFVMSAGTLPWCFGRGWQSCARLQLSCLT